MPNIAHVKQDKLEARALKCVMVGYPHGVKIMINEATE